MNTANAPKDDKTNSKQLEVSGKTSYAVSLAKAASAYLPAAPRPLDKPNVDKELENLPVVERVTESLKYNLLSLEYAISPKGGLRQWIKLNFSVLILLGLPAILFIPLFAYVMFGFEAISGLFASGTHLLVLSAQNILKLIVLVVIIATLIYAIFHFLKKWHSGRKKESFPDQDDIIDISPRDKAKRG